MRISLVVAHTINRVIGRDGDMPWRLSGDLRNFKRLTMNHSMVMGRKTFDSIGRVLPGRQTIVLTRNENYAADGVSVAHNWEQAISLAISAEQMQQDELFVVGGAQIYEMALPLADRIYLTEIDATVEGDTFFPTIDGDQWVEVERSPHPADERNEHNYSFVTLERKNTADR